MQHKTLFRLGVKMLGLVFIAIYGVRLLQGVALTASEFFISGYIPNGRALSQMFIQSEGRFASIGLLLIGLYLFFGGKWIVNLAIPSNRPYCPECGFDLSGQRKVAVCAECGTTIPAEVLSQIKAAPGQADEPVPPDLEEP